MSSQRAMPGGAADRANLPKGPNGRFLCRWCNLEVPPGRQTFCSDWCVEEWKLRTDPGHLRERVFARDRGICAQCGLDCIAAFRHIRKLRGAARLRVVGNACCLAGLMALACAAPAIATDVGVDGTALRVVDEAGDANALDVRFNLFGYVVYDDLS